MATYAETTAALKYLVEFSGTCKVDNDGYVLFKHGKYVKVKTKTGNKNLIILQEVIKDPEAQIFNPFVEGVVSPDQTWFYETIEGALSYRIVKLIEFVVENALNKEDMPTKVVKLVSPYIKLVDSKTSKEVEDICQNLRKLISVFYNKRYKLAKFNINLFEGEAFKEDYKARKKTWNFLEKLLADIFNLETDIPFDDIFKDYSAKASSLGYPKLEAVLKVYHKVYTTLNPYFRLMDAVLGTDENTFRFSIDTDELNDIIDNLDSYFEKARAFVQPTVAQPSQRTDSHAANNMPMPGQGIPGREPVGGMPMPGGHGNVPIQSGNVGNMPMPNTYMQQQPMLQQPQVQPQFQHMGAPIPSPSPMPGVMGNVNQPPYLGVNVPQPGTVGNMPNPYGTVPQPTTPPMYNTGYPNPGYGPIGGVHNAQVQIGNQPSVSGYGTPVLSSPTPLL
jgi:hypothetical protein